MKIALLCFDKVRSDFLAGLKKGLEDRQHDVRMFYQSGASGNQDGHYPMNWLHFETQTLTDFQPDRVVFFNGFAPESSGATSWLRQKFNTLFVERAWLPQGKNIYIDSEGLGGRSSLAKKNLAMHLVEETRAMERTIEKLKTDYRPGDPPGVDDYILVPLQLEHDTSITLDSPYFKTMRSLVDFVLAHFPDHKIIVKPHPYAIHFQPRKHEIVVTNTPMNTLAAHAKAIIGINSTSLIEALVHEKPIAALGNGVLMNSGVFLSAKQMLSEPRSILGFKPTPRLIHAALYNLYNRQFLCTDPPAWAIRQIEDGA